MEPDSEGPSQDELLALFRARREQKAAAKTSDDQALASALGSSKTASSAPPAATHHSAPSLHAAPASPSSPPARAVAPAPPPASVTIPAPEPSPRASPPAPAPVAQSIALRPASSPGLSLAAAGPVLRLSDRLLEDAQVTSRGSVWGRRIGFLFACAGLLALAIERRATLQNGVQYTLGRTALPALLVPVALALVGVVLMALFTVLPPGRRLTVRFAASQKEEWERVQTEARRLRLLGAFGVAILFLGLLGLATAYALMPLGVLLLAAAAGAIAVGLCGLAVTLWAAGRRTAVHRLYVQTMVLARLEGSGLGPGGAPDGRLGPVLTALDSLLGSLPEAAVRQFLASPQAQDYLDLIEESSEGRHG